MSVFKVDLNNKLQGYLDIDPLTGLPFDASNNNPSVQRTMYVNGPMKKIREVKDGTTFTDCNYWKRFAYPQVPENQAFIEVVTDDGSIWSDDPAENTFPVVQSGTIAAAGSTTVDFLSMGGFAVFTQIENKGANPLTIKLNGNAAASFDLAASATQIFNKGDMNLSSLVLESTSGTDYMVLASVQAQANS